MVLFLKVVGNHRQLQSHPGMKSEGPVDVIIMCGLVLLLVKVLALQLMHPILESLRNTENQWLIDTLYAFNSGNVETFFSLKTNWGSQAS